MTPSVICPLDNVKAGCRVEHEERLSVSSPVLFIQNGFYHCWLYSLCITAKASNFKTLSTIKELHYYLRLCSPSSQIFILEVAHRKSNLLGQDCFTGWDVGHIILFNHNWLRIIGSIKCILSPASKHNMMPQALGHGEQSCVTDRHEPNFDLTTRRYHMMPFTVRMCCIICELGGN